MMRRRPLLLAVVALLVFAGCGADPPSAAPDGDRPDAAVPGSTGPPASGESPAGAPAGAPPQTLAFTATTVPGCAVRTLNAGGKPVVFWFWASWGPRFRAAVPEWERGTGLSTPDPFL